MVPGKRRKLVGKRRSEEEEGGEEEAMMALQEADDEEEDVAMAEVCVCARACVRARACASLLAERRHDAAKMKASFSNDEQASSEYTCISLILTVYAIIRTRFTVLII